MSSIDTEYLFNEDITHVKPKQRPQVWLPFNDVEFLTDFMSKQCESYFQCIGIAIQKKESTIRNILYKYLLTQEHMETPAQLKKFTLSTNGNIKILKILSEMLKIDIYLFQDENLLPHEISGGYNRIIFLTSDFLVLGRKTKTKKPKIIFNSDEIKLEFDKENIIVELIIDFYKKSSNFTLPDLINHLDITLSKKLTLSERRLVFTIFKKMFDKVEFKEHPVKIRKYINI